MSEVTRPDALKQASAQLIVKIDDKLKVLNSKFTAPEDGYYIGYLFAAEGGSGRIKGDIIRNGSVTWSVGLSVHLPGGVNVPYNSFAYPVKKGDECTYDIQREGTVAGGIGFDPIGEHA